MPELIEPKFILQEEVIVPNAIEDGEGDIRSEEAVIVGIIRDTSRADLIRYKVQFKDPSVQADLFKAVYQESELEKK